MKATPSRPPTERPRKKSDDEHEEELQDIAHEVFMALGQGAALARMIALALYHSSDEGDVDAARLGCEGIAVLLDRAADRAQALHAALEAQP